jgi:hypothetical protein
MLEEDNKITESSKTNSDNFFLLEAKSIALCVIFFSFFGILPIKMPLARKTLHL